MEHTRAFLAYDTLCRIAAEIPEDGEQLLEQCEEEAHGLERTLSMFDPDSELSRLCRDIRPGEAVPVSETLYTFLEQNLEICRLSSGAFDPTVGPVVKLWDFLSQTPRIPSAERIRAVLDRVGYQHVRLDRNTRTVTFDLLESVWIRAQPEGLRPGSDRGPPAAGRRPAGRAGLRREHVCDRCAPGRAGRDPAVEGGDPGPGQHRLGVWDGAAQGRGHRHILLV